MRPPGRDLRERAHDEAAFVGAGVRQGQAMGAFGGIDDPAAVGDQVKIERAGGVPAPTGAPQFPAKLT